MEVAAAILYPFFLKISGQDRDLIGSGAYGAVEIDPVGVGVGHVLVARGSIIESGHAFGVLQAMFVARAVIG
jgi:hypothetical protein